MNVSQIFKSLVVTVALFLLLPACLKTRAQLKQQGGSGMVNAAEAKAETMGQSYAIDEIKGELARLSGRLEDLERKNAQSQDNPEGKTEMEELKKRIQSLESTQLQVLETLKRMENKLRDPQTVFEEGKQQLKSGRLPEAVVSFSHYIKANPKGKTAAEAHFLRGETYYRLGKFSDAILDYTRIESHHRKSKYMAGALYKMGLSYESLGEKSVAQGYYEELVNKFPKTNMAKKARTKIKHERKTSPKRSSRKRKKS